MAQMNDNWLLSHPSRKRGHIPIQVTIDVEPDDVEWGGEKPVAAIKFKRANEKYLPVYLTAGDVEVLIRRLWAFAPRAAWRSLAHEALVASSNSELLAILQHAFAKRRQVVLK